MLQDRHHGQGGTEVGGIMDIFVYFPKGCLSVFKPLLIRGLKLLLRVSEANEVPISSHIWVGLSTLNRL